VLAGGPGFGAALRIGLASARFPLLAHATADRCYRPGDLQRLLDEIDQVDLVSGFRASQPVPLLLRGVGAVIRRLSRWLAGLPLEPLPGWLGWQGQAYGWLVRLLFGVRVRDVQSELKLFRREIFTRLPIQCDGPAVHAEVLAKANFLGCLMAEVPVSYRPGQPPPPPWRAIVPELRRLLATPEFRPAAGGGPANETSGSQLGGNTNVG
jgi:dolichol-phosphate mannosyltransferase